MDRYRCSQCTLEFFIKNQCSCSPLPAGPHFCPECGGELYRVSEAYFLSPEDNEID